MYQSYLSGEIRSFTAEPSIHPRHSLQSPALTVSPRHERSSEVDGIESKSPVPPSSPVRREVAQLARRSTLPRHSSKAANELSGRRF
jgi:hypothetical protein